MRLAKILENNTVVLVALIAVLLLYFVVNDPVGNVHIVKSALDTYVPFIPVFSVPYLLFLPALAGTIIYAFVTDTRFKALALSIIVVYVLSYIVYMVFQTYVPRPAVEGHDVFSDLVRWIYGHDKPYNGMPSTHASGVTILAVYYLRTKIRLGYSMVAFGVLVVLSTLFVKQHFILDVVTGVTLGLVVSTVTFRLTS